jgi:hypothetical protein
MIIPQPKHEEVFAQAVVEFLVALNYSPLFPPQGQSPKGTMAKSRWK